MPGIRTHRFTGLTAPPSPEVEAGHFLTLDYRQVKKFCNFVQAFGQEGGGPSCEKRMVGQTRP
jgi:hypothetical protein